MRHALVLLVTTIFVASATPAAAQRNPFAEEPPTAPPAEDPEVAPADGGDAEVASDADAAPVEEAPAAPPAVEESAPEEPEPTPEPEAAPPKPPKPAKQSPTDRVRLTENYSAAELITTGVVLPLGLGLAIGGPSLFGEPAASMTAPRLGSIDYKLSISSHGNLRDGAPFAFGIFDIGAVVYPAAIGTFYLVSGLYLWGADEPMLGSQSFNIDHSMIGIAQTAGWTALASGVAHLLVGREKPYAAFNRSGYGSPEDDGANLSFVSTATAMSFALSSFAARDYADWATRNGQGYVTGVVLPYVVMYGLSAVIGYSAIYGQQHYFSDIAVSAVLGSLIGNLTYVAHFDSDGHPRRRHATREALSFAPTLLQAPSGEARVGLGLGTWF